MFPSNVIRSFNLGSKSFLKYHSFVSFIVYFELLILSTIVTSIHPIPFDANSVVTPGINYVLFVVLLPLVTYRNSELPFRNRLDLSRLFLHALTLLIFVLYLFYFVEHYPFQPLDKTNILKKIAVYLNKGDAGLLTRFSFLFLLISVCCHYSLLQSVLYGRRIYREYAFSILIAFFLGTAYVLFFADYFWNYASFGVAQIVFLFLKISGLKPVFFYSPGHAPIIGTSSFTVSIAYPCSGISGIMTFLLVLSVIAILKWEKMNKTKLFVVGYVGTFIMYITNLIRIYILILIGHFAGKSLADDLWHSEGSTIYYAAVIIIILSMSYRWMNGADDTREAKQVARSVQGGEDKQR